MQSSGGVMVGLRFPLSPLWFVLGLRFRVKWLRFWVNSPPGGSLAGLGFRA